VSCFPDNRVVISDLLCLFDNSVDNPLTLAIGNEPSVITSCLLTNCATDALPSNAVCNPDTSVISTFTLLIKRSTSDFV